MKISLISKAGIFTHLIFLVPVRQYSRARGGNEGFPAQFLGNSYFCGIFLFQPSGKARRKRFERIDGSFSNYPISVRFKSLDVIRSRAVRCHFSPLYIAPEILQNKERETMRLQLQKAALPSFSVLVIPPDSSTQLLRRCHLV